MRPRRVGPAGAAMTMFICLLVCYRLLAKGGMEFLRFGVPTHASCARLGVPVAAMDSLGLSLFDSEIRVGPLAAWLAPEEFQNLQLNHQYQLLMYQFQVKYHHYHH